MHHAIALAFAAATLSQPVPEMPTVYPQVPEQQICALVMDHPCNPDPKKRKEPAAWFGATGTSGEWVAVASILPKGSMYWQGALVHEMAHVVQKASMPHTLGMICYPVLEAQALLVMEAWFQSKGFEFEEITGFPLPPLAVEDEELVAVCGSPALPEAGEKYEHGTESTP